MVASAVLASLVQRDFGNVEVLNARYDNLNGISVRAKLFRPKCATPAEPVPGLVYVHGYQNNRETGDAYCLELARRGFVVLSIDAIGRGNSGVPNDPDDPGFDSTYGTAASLEYLKGLPYVDADFIGLLGHSLGAEMAYNVALADRSVRGLVITGFGYTMDASPTVPANMLMIIGEWDEFRDRMTGVGELPGEWMNSPRTRNAIPVDDPRLGVTYGDFSDGSARRVFMPRAIHIQESHSSAAIAETVSWMRDALSPPERSWKDPDHQVWQLKEWATLLAMLACFAALLPLGLMLLRTRFFRPLAGGVRREYACSPRAYFGLAAVNGLLMWLYLPLVFVLFGLHIYVVSVDALFPMMIVNGVVWWFVWINVIGLFLFRRWFRKQRKRCGLTLADLGVSYRNDRFALDGPQIGRTAVLAAFLFLFAYSSEHILEALLIVDFRFIFPFASDLTPYRALMFLPYFPFLLIGFVLTGVFLHGQLRPAHRETRLGTFVFWSTTNVLALVVPLLLFLALQYGPLLVAGVIPFVGPGGMLASFTINLFHIVGVLIMVTPLSTWFYQLTGRIYLGAFVNAALVTWMFTSSQVIAPIPV